MRRVACAALLWGFGLGLARAGAAEKPAGQALFGRAPYDAPGESPHRVRVSLDLTAARQILDALSLDRPKPGDASALLALPAVQRQVAESGEGDPAWIEDFNGAFAADSRPSTFDLRSVRIDRERWRIVLASLEEHAERLAKLSERRVAALLPPDRPVAITSTVLLTFGLPGLADHLVFTARDRGSATIVVDVGRALPVAGASSPQQGEDALARLVAAETFRPAWDAFRAGSAGWKAPQEGLGGAEPLARAVAVMAPVWLYSYDPDFFPLSEWLRDPMVRATDAFNQEADLLLDPKTDLARRAEILARLEHRTLQNDVALAAGLFFADGIYQTLGREELFKALESGPEGLVAAYARAAEKKRSLPPLSRALRERMERHPAAASRKGSGP